MARKYFRASYKELESLFKNNLSDESILFDLMNELKHRKSKAAKRLLVSVRQKLNSANVETATKNSHKQATIIKKVTKTIKSETKKVTPNSHFSSTSSKVKIEPKNNNLASLDLTNGGHAALSKEKISSPNRLPRKNVSIHSIGFIRPCGVIKGVPSSYNYKVSDKLTLNLNKRSPVAERFSVAICALIEQVRKRGLGLKCYDLINGRKVILDGGKNGLKFPTEYELQLYEGARVQLEVKGVNYEGEIVSIINNHILLSIEEELENISSCTMRVDSTGILKILAEQLEKISESGNEFNHKLANSVLNNSGEELNQPSLINVANLNAQQSLAVSKMLTEKVTYLWGPPGTGKTESLTIAIQKLYEANKRVLICSNTNQAVDQILLKTCRRLTSDSPAILNGKVVRVGQIHLHDLKDEWSQYITLDGIAAKRSEGLLFEKEKLKQDLIRLTNENSSLEKIMENFERLNFLKNEQLKQKQELSNKKDAIIKIKLSISRNENELRKLKDEKQKIQDAGVIKKLILRNIKIVNNEINQLSIRLKNSFKELENAIGELDILQTIACDARLEEEIDTLTKKLSDFNETSIEKKHKEYQELARTINVKITEVDKKLEGITKSVLEDSQVVGATVTKLYLSHSLFPKFDVIIIDEASMVQLPVVYYTAGLAKDSVIISGDFRQLSPIIPTNEKVILDEIGEDIFSRAGIKDAFQNKEKLKRTVFLDVQYRMQENICNLISPRMYGGKLRTATVPPPTKLPAPFSHNLIVIDTSLLNPFVNKRGSSRYNLLHAILVRNLSEKINDFNPNGTLGVCTPYAAQRDFIYKILKDNDLESKVESGTVHRFQGDEKDTLILDVPDSYGEFYVGGFAQAEFPDDSGSKLFNVAVSRSKGNLIVLANLEYLDSKLPENAFLREILFNISNKGQIINGVDVLAFKPPLESDFKYGLSFETPLEALKSGLFKQAEFDPVFISDVNTAKNTILIFSGFVTSSRIASYEKLFKNCINRGVKIRCVTRTPSRNGSMSFTEGEAALNKLEELGCIVDTRWDIHEKVIIVDDEIVWVGSLNPLSHTSSTSEVMLRLVGYEVANQLSEFLSISGPNYNQKNLSVIKENPICEYCSSRTVYRTGRYGIFWECEKRCGWKQNLKKK